METERCSICSLSQAKFSCSCALPSLPICETCLLSHLSTAGSHITVSLHPRVTATSLAGNEVCDECGSRPADYFCLCSSSLRKFCRGCDIPHYQKTQSRVHFKHPIIGYQGVVSSRMPIEQFKKKQFYINDLLLRLEEEVSSFDAFVKRAETEFSTLQQKIAAKKTEFLREMQTQREKLIAAIRDANQNIESKRYVENLEVISYLDDSIVHGHQYPWMNDTRLFIGNVKVQPIYQALEKLVDFEVGGILLEKAQAIPVFKEQTLTLYQHRLEQIPITLDLPLKTDIGTAYCYIGKWTILCFGGYNSNLVCEVNGQSGQVVQVSSLPTVKGFLGVWNYQNMSVFIFGGSYMNTYYNTSEKYTINAKTCTPISKLMMRIKAYCSVCEHATGLYVSGNCTYEHSIELFKPLNEAFTLLLTESVAYRSMICCVGDDLYQFVNGSVQVASLADGVGGLHFTVKETFPQIGDGNYWANFPLRSFKGEFMCVFYMNSPS